ncbi:hypothetical protein ZOSMA_125G00650 [Zostera marina]|uniref:Uncharacterized protein n=1 Tax=Zostera marina TaxID=29655 RepID=A0A0K9Q013_ZOSMR|nr:hypothetical protein ZOSMA_125G00650 [Zostera marina]
MERKGRKKMEGETKQIIRTTVYTFFRNYHSFTSVVVLLAFPASASILLSQPILPAFPDLFLSILSRIRLLLHAAGIPTSSEFSVAVNVKFAQIIFTYVLSLPFTITFLLLAKACVIAIVCRSSSSGLVSSSLGFYLSLLWTNLCGSFTILTANAAVFSILFIIFNIADLLLPIISPNFNLAVLTAGAVLYSLVISHVTVVCNLAVVITGVENRGGFLQLLKAFLLVRRRPAIALTLTLFGSIAVASTEALFYYRIMKPYRLIIPLVPSILFEAVFIAYLRSIVVVLDVIATCVFYNKFGSDKLPEFVEQSTATVGRNKI